ncbi:MAG: carboxypeptidase-like regulatory domain-containing protein [Gammaproteobacteria bacterium]|nr:carboxypeptidase-like regulatory domain-containing protein [Gammaproteobacteria bacterium]
MVLPKAGEVCSSFFAFLSIICFNLLLLAMPLSANAATWTDVSSQLTIDTSSPVRSRRNPDATVTINLTNSGTNTVNAPLRLVLGTFTPDTVSLQGVTGQTDAGEPYMDLGTYVGSGLAAGASTGPITLTILGGGSVNFSFFPRVEQEQVAQLTVKITEPATLITVGSSPLQVSGTVSDPASTVTLNGAIVPHSGGTFSAAVSLEEGHNTVIARVVNSAGEEVTDSISVSLDKTPPYITIDNPVDGQTVSIASIPVSGLVNDIVRGTVSEAQANVLVNGVQAGVSNRSYLAQNITLQEGVNTITVTASDQVGNTASKSITINYVPPAPKHIAMVSGQNQKASIRSVLTNPIVVKLVESDGSAGVGKNVVFRVTQGDGVVGAGTSTESQGVLVVTDANGVAQTSFKLGSRSGNGNQRVRARAVGYDGEVVFHASATTNPGDKVSVNSGNNQRGAVNQPLPQPFVAVVTDGGANVVENAQIEFAITKGSGRFQNGQAAYIATTDSDGRATAHMTLGSEAGFDVQRVTATLSGTGLHASFTASGFVPADPGNTRISGIVLDNQDVPLPGMTIRVEGTTRQGVTDAQGQFNITEVPVGPVHLIADGSTTGAPGEWPTLSYNIVTIAGVDNPMAAPIYMVRLNTDSASLAGREDIALTLPEVPGFKLEVKAGSVTFPDGSKEGLISVTPVNASKVPMAPPNGMQPQFIVTIQPAGTKFDPPAPLTLPNVDAHLPGAQVEMYSYDHDLEEFVAIGLGTVSKDGTVIKTNPGVGVIKAGWHCGSQPGGNGCCSGGGGGGCPKCSQPDSGCESGCRAIPDCCDPPVSCGECQQPSANGCSCEPIPPETCGACESPTGPCGACEPNDPAQCNPDNCEQPSADGCSCEPIPPVECDECFQPTGACGQQCEPIPPEVCGACEEPTGPCGACEPIDKEMCTGCQKPSDDGCSCVDIPQPNCDSSCEIFNPDTCQCDPNPATAGRRFGECQECRNGRLTNLDGLCPSTFCTESVGCVNGQCGQPVPRNEGLVIPSSLGCYKCGGGKPVPTGDCTDPPPGEDPPEEPPPEEPQPDPCSEPGACNNGSTGEITLKDRRTNARVRDGSTVFININGVMPQLYADIRYSGTAPESVVWDFSSNHPRRNVDTTASRSWLRRYCSDSGEDSRTQRTVIPPGDEWDLFSSYAWNSPDFTFGAASPYTDDRQATVSASNADSIRFNIKGVNPFKADVQYNITNHNPPPNHQYAYQMSLHESGTTSNEARVRQFIPASRAERERGLPTYGPPDGWGAFQIDNKCRSNGTRSGVPVPTEVLWNWPSNVSRGITILNQKAVGSRRRYDGIANYWRTAIGAADFEPLPTVIQVNGVNIHPQHACAIQAYNGVAGGTIVEQPYLPIGGRYPQDVSYVGFCMFYDETAPRGSRWTFRNNGNHYVGHVLQRN